MSNDPHRPHDPYSRVNYRRLFAWDERIAREAPFFRELLAKAPDRSVLDLGCGTGEHVAFFSQEGLRAVGLDLSESMISAARDHERAGHGRFVLGDATEALTVLAEESPFGLAICLGNMLPHLEDADLGRFLRVAQAMLLPGGTLVIQLLNYEPVLAGQRRTLPVNVRPGDDGKEIVFVRVMSAGAPGRVLFFPSTFELDHDAEEPLTVKSSRRVDLRAWTRADLEPALDTAGFDSTFSGDMTGGAFEPERSADLVVVASRRGRVNLTQGSRRRRQAANEER